MCPREEKPLAQRHIASEWKSLDLDSGQFHGLFSLPHYLVKVDVNGKKYYRDPILTL